MTNPDGRDDHRIEVALARLEGKIDALTPLVGSVTDIDSRVRTLESGMAAIRQQINDQTASRINWPAFVSAIAALLMLAVIVGDRIYHWR